MASVDLGRVLRLLLLAALTLQFCTVTASPGQASPLGLTMQPAGDEGALGKVSRGVFRVFENRTTWRGRILDLDVMILHARAQPQANDPVVLLVGGPGLAATKVPELVASHPIREHRDFLLIDQRGTAGNHSLACVLIPDDAPPQRHLEAPYAAGALRDCLRRLRAKADLTQYSNPISAADLNDIRAAFGYAKLNLMGHSGGSRAALEYLRMFPQYVRSAIISGVVPPEFTIPLYHPAAAQRALDQILALCIADVRCAQAYPNIQVEFDTVMRRLAQGPVRLDYRDPVRGTTSPVVMDRTAFGEALRQMLYDFQGALRAPLVINRAYHGDFAPLVASQVETSKRTFSRIAWGMNLTLICSEDVARIDPAMIKPIVGGSFVGDFRVRNQIEACRHWPRTRLPQEFGTPVRSDVPVLLISGAFDPVTPPFWGELAARSLANARHVVLPAGHNSFSQSCAKEIAAQFVMAGSGRTLDTSCVAKTTPLIFPTDPDR